MNTILLIVIVIVVLYYIFFEMCSKSNQTRIKKVGNKTLTKTYTKLCEFINNIKKVILKYVAIALAALGLQKLADKTLSAGEEAAEEAEAEGEAEAEAEAQEGAEEEAEGDAQEEAEEEATEGAEAEAEEEVIEELFKSRRNFCRVHQCRKQYPRHQRRKQHS